MTSRDSESTAMWAVAHSSPAAPTTPLERYESLVESKKSRNAVLREQLLAQRKDLAELERWRAMLRHYQNHDGSNSGTHASQAAEAFRQREQQEYQELLRAPPKLVSKAEREYATLVRRQTHHRRLHKQLSAEAARVARGAVDRAHEIESCSVQLAAAYVAEEARARVAVAAAEAECRAQLDLDCLCGGLRVQQRAFQLHQRQSSTCAALELEIRATDALCTTTQLQLSSMQEEDSALARDQDATLEQWQETQRSCERFLSDSLSLIEADGSQLSAATHAQLEEVLTKVNLAALHMLGHTRDHTGFGSARGNATLAMEPAANGPMVPPDYLAEVELMFAACLPFQRSQVTASQSQLKQLQVLWREERNGLLHSQQALQGLVDEKNELMQLLHDM